MIDTKKDKKLDYPDSKLPRLEGDVSFIVDNQIAGTPEHISTKRSRNIQTETQKETLKEAQKK